MVVCVSALALGLPAGSVTGADAATVGLRVSGSTLKLNGTAFMPRGFNMIGALAGPGCIRVDDAAAAAHLTAQEMTALAGTWHANTLRFQVSQSALSDTEPTRVSEYLGTIANAVSLARAAHLVVILSMQDADLSCGPNHDLPSAATQRAWDNLAPVYAGAPDVMYELFNEPHEIVDPKPELLKPLSADGWNQWLNGGTVPDPNQDGAIGHQQLLQHIRSLGVRNVLLIDGRNRAGVLPGPNQNVPLVHDTMNPANIVYALHPYYYYDPIASADWEFRFGSIAQTVPVIATEWNYLVAGCATSKQFLAAGFLRYLNDRGIGVLGMAGDFRIGAGLIADWNWAPTVCPGSTDGPGAVFLDYLTRAQTPRPSVVSLTPMSPQQVGSTLTVTGALRIDGALPSVPVAITATRTGGTGTEVLTPVRTGIGGAFTFVGGVATQAGTYVFKVKYAGNAVTKASTQKVTVVITAAGAATAQ